jgi:hypothetical protein
MATDEVMKGQEKFAMVVTISAMVLFVTTREVSISVCVWLMLSNHMIFRIIAY